MNAAVTPDAILQLGFGFWGPKALLSAVELNLFTELAHGPLDAKGLAERIGIHARAARDFFDALVALGMLRRANTLYANTPETDLFLDRAKSSYVGGILEMANARLYPFWASLTEGLRTGRPQNEAKVGGDFFAALYADSARLAQFTRAMTALNMGAAQAIARRFPWAAYSNVVDVGTAEGNLLVQIARVHPGVSGVGFDLAPVASIFTANVTNAGLNARLRFQAGDFFVDPLPAGDVIVMGLILHDWDLEQKRHLIRKAYGVLRPNGALLVYDTIIDDDRSENAFGLLMSLNMLIETPGGFDYTGADCIGWMREAGFREAAVEHLVGPTSMVVGIK